MSPRRWPRPGELWQLVQQPGVVVQVVGVGREPGGSTQELIYAVVEDQVLRPGGGGRGHVVQLMMYLATFLQRLQRMDLERVTVFRPSPGGSR